MKACTRLIPGALCFRILFLFQMTATLLHAQHYLFKTYNHASGIPSDYILCIMQDRDGFLWFGTDRGACRYDGNTYLTYTTTDGLGSNFVTSIFQDRQGALWFGLYEGGVTRLDRNGYVTFNRQHGLPGKSVLNILQDRYDRLYFDTDEGICLLYHDSVTCLPFRSQSRLLAQLADGTILIEDSLSYRLILPSPDCTLQTKPLSIPDHLNKFFTCRFGPRRALVRNNGNICLVGIPGFIELSGITGHRATVVRELPTISMESITEDHEGTLWCGTELSGIIKIPASGSPGASTGKATAHKRISSAFCDREGTLWFGTMGEGAQKLLGTHILAYDSRNGLPSSDVTTIFQDSHQNTWFGTRVGLAVLNHDRPVRLSPSYASLNEIRSIAESPEGYYIGTFKHLIGPQSLTAMKSPNPPPFRWVAYGVSSLAVDSTQHPSRVWLSTYGGGTFRFSERDTMSYFDRTDRYSLRGVFVSEMIESIVPGTHSLWFLSRNLGASRWANGTATHFSTTNGLPSNAVYAVTEMEDGAIWFGTDAGAAYVSAAGVTTVSSREGLRGKTVMAIIPVHGKPTSSGTAGGCWIVTDQSLHKYSEGTLQRYGSYPLLPSVDASMNSLHYVQETSTLWIATTGGGMKVDLSSISDRSLPPAISLISAQNDSTLFFCTTPGRWLNHDESIMTLAPDQNQITLTFAGLSYSNERDVSYSYRLSGWSDQWSAPTNERIVRFHNLSPGTYTFAVVAINPDGVRSAEPATFTFIITPPLWRRSWFLGLLLLLILGMLIGTVRYFSLRKLRTTVERLEREKVMQHEREETRARIARDLHDDISSTLGSIALYSESLKRQSRQLSERQRSMLERIGALASEAVDHMGDIIWSVAPEHDSFNDLLSRMRNLAVELCSMNKMEYELNLRSAPEDFSMTEEVRRNIYLTFKEALNNIIKHANASRVAVSAHLEEGLFIMIIEDDGTGFSMKPADAPAKRRLKQSRQGHGLHNLQHRAEEIGAVLEIHSARGRGTTIIFRKRMT